ncbi:MAG: hypothetical protein AAFW98_08130, partial [Pseudomonadota bacterium]
MSVKASGATAGDAQKGTVLDGLVHLDEIAEPAPVNRFAVPPGVRAYAVGDIHGHLDLLMQMQGLIDADISADPPERMVEIYLGDYVDRGAISLSSTPAESGPR